VSGPPPPKFPGGSDPIKDGPRPAAPPPQSAAPPSPADQAVLAGRVLDPYNRPPTNAYVRWVRVEDNKESGSPIDVEVDPQGWFFIPGLKSDTQYKLIARSKQGDKVLAGITFAKAPYTKLLIQVKEDFAAAAEVDRPKEAPAKTSADARAQPATAWSTNPPGAGVSAVNNAVPELPMQLNVPTPPRPTTSAVTPPSWSPPVLNIKNPESRAPAPAAPAQPQPPPLTPGDGKLSHAAPRVPSCVVVGKQLYNLALRDTAGGVWEFRTSKKGKLVLFDFWACDCMPCRQTMPELSRMQTQYRAQGLEVVGIALEDGTADQQVMRVTEVCRRLKVAYRQLLGEPARSNINTQLGIQSVPKLVLVDEEGWILWEHVGLPDRATLGEVESLIQRRLTSRAS
jgi:thiol-disulfide isomerase/thioredoxin